MDSGADLRRLTSLRAFAAFAVFLHHVGNESNWLWHDRYVRYGSAGVAFFFVLSGFVLTWAWREGDGSRAFYIRRFARIWPAHVVALATGVAVFAYSDPRVTWDAVLANLLLLQAWAPPPLNTLNGVSWSLSVEAFFYALAPFIIVASRRLPQRSFLLGAGALVTLTLVIRVVWSSFERGGETNYYLYEQPALRLGRGSLIRAWWSAIVDPCLVLPCSQMPSGAGSSR